MTLATRTYTAARWTTASSVTRAALQLLQIAVLARFLSPADYGLMSMVNVVLSYAALFSDMGLSTAFVQRQQISHEERSSLYWLSVAVGGALMLLVMGISPFAAMFFKEPKLMPLMLLVATNFLVIALGQQLRIDAEKSLNFRPVALIEIFASLVGFVVAAFTAWVGWGVYALVVAAMSSAWLTMILSWLVLAQGWRPAWRLCLGEVRWFVQFGGTMVLNNVINHVNATIDLVLGGKMLGASQLGLYSVPRNLILQVQFLINPIFTRVGFPLIASIQHDKELVKQVYLKTMNLAASLNAPSYAAIAVFAPEIVEVLLGNRWSNATSLMQVLSLWGLFRSFANPVGSLLFGLGHVRLSTQWNAGMLLIAPTVIWFGSRWGAIGMAWSMAGIMIGMFIPIWIFLIRPTCGADFREYACEIIKPIICVLIAVVPTVVLKSQFGPSYLISGVAFSMGVLVYFVASFFFNKRFFNTIFRSLK